MPPLRHKAAHKVTFVNVPNIRKGSYNTEQGSAVAQW